MTKEIFYNKDAIDDLKRVFADTFLLDEQHVWADGNQIHQVLEGKRLGRHDLKFTLSFPSGTRIALPITRSQKYFGWSIFHTASLDYSDFTDRVTITFEIDYETCTQILAIASVPKIK